MLFTDKTIIDQIPKGFLPKDKADKDGYVWEFAYGANISDVSFKKRRGLNAIEQHKGILQDWQLTFDYVGFPFFESTFGNIQYRQGSQVHGILHKIKLSDYHRLQKTEGGGGIRDGYHPILLDFITYDGKKIQAWAFKCHHNYLVKQSTKINQYPSSRYVNMIIEGAKSQNLEPSYIEFLEQIQTIELQNILQRIFKFFVQLIIYPAFLIFMLMIKIPVVKQYYVYFHELIFLPIVLFIFWNIYNLLPEKYIQCSPKDINNNEIFYKVKKE